MFQPSNYQIAVFNWIDQGQGDAVVNAVAGSGKTTSLIEAASLLKVRRAIFVAFNKGIAEELATRLQERGANMQASTIHSLGKRALEKHFGARSRVVGNKYRKLCKNYLNAKDREYLTTHLQKLVNFSQLTLTEPTERNLLNIIDHYGLDDIPVSNKEDWPIIWRSVSLILEAGKAQAKQEFVIDFNDMVWLPTEIDIPLPVYDFLFVDEAQDLNRAQLELMLRCRAPGGRFLFVGDRKQSLYGFAGADTQSVDNIVARTNATELPLSICYRCPTSHVALAQQVVPQIEPSPYASEGETGILPVSSLALVIPSTENTCMVLCRTTAPLVSACLKVLQSGRRAIVRGKDIGASIIDILDKLAGKNIATFRINDVPEALEKYLASQLAGLQAKEDNELAIESLYDRVDTVEALLMAYLAESEASKLPATMQGLKAFIEAKFDDSTSEDTLIFSTVHKAKGLEFDTVYILRSDLMPHPAAKKDWQISQEFNIIYVALTRAKKRLYFLDQAIPWLAGVTPPEESQGRPVLPVPTVAAKKVSAKMGRPRKGEEIRERVNISLDVDVIRFLRSQKNYSEMIEGLILALPEFDEFLKHD